DFTEHTIAGDFDFAISVYAADIDGDGDMDVLGAAAGADDITWWESDLDPWLRWLALPDTGFVEDGSLSLSLEYLYDHIFSPVFPDSSLVISVEDGEHVFGEMGDEGLTITADQDWNGIDSLMLTVTDPDENSDSTYQHVIVVPVNDLPSAFGLLEPANNSEVADYPLVTFGWEESADEADDDTVTYDFVMTIDLDDHWYTGIEGTSFEINREDLSIDPNQETSLVWGVWAHDGTDSIFANEPFSLTVAPLSVSEHGVLLPTELSLGQIYPNPFNSTTSISFGLPKRSTVRINVLDLYGRTVVTLADRDYEAGFHSVTWDAVGFPTGVYFVRLKASDQLVTQKVMLIR
ncbi:T9SS type A sorting domain-containing protein, partial [bacterium]|nr:T9SS type A sorting domain-containing protein [bacterium]